MKNIYLLLALSFFLFEFDIAKAQQPELLKDINTETAEVLGPGNLFDYNGILLCVLYNENKGRELYRSDGTKQGTLLIKDINSEGDSKPESFCLVNDEVFFSARTNQFERELWKTDGTEEGTVLVKDINPSSEDDAIIGEIVSLNGIAYFGAFDGTHGIELWRSDGSEAGTYMVKDINPDQASTEAPELLTVSNGLVYFTVVDGSHGRELWKSDGTTNGTVLVKNIRSGNKSTDFTEIVAFGSGVLINADDHSSGPELWISNGTGSGTQLVSDINPGSNGSNPSEITLYSGIAYFSATDPASGNELWRSDGTSGGTYRVKDIYPGATGSEPVYLTVSGNTLFFSATDNVHGTEVHVSDGSEAGTGSLGNFTPGQGGSQVDLTDNCGTLFFITEKDDEEKLWISDGTPVGTHEVPGSSGPNYEGGLTSSNCLAFYSTGGGGSGLWVSNGTDDGTNQVKIVADETLSGGPDDFIVVGNHLFFAAFDETHGTGLWAKDLTTAEVYFVKDVVPTGNSTLDNMIELNGLLYFEAGEALWKSDGTEAGTIKVSDLEGGENPTIAAITTMNDILYFVVGTAYELYSLWRSDGTEEGTTLLSAIGPGDYISDFYVDTDDLIHFNGTLLFPGHDLVNGTELWESDGTAEGTGLFVDLRPGTQSSYPGNFISINGGVAFEATDGPHGYELWKSDGSAGGTQMIKDIFPGPEDGVYYNDKIFFNGQILFSANDGATGEELWKSDGTAAGTSRLKNINPGSDGSFPSVFRQVNNAMYFTATTLANGKELWKTNGTSSGTVLVKDINPGEESSNPETLTEVNSKLFFIADDGIHGEEIWGSDGGDCNTFLITEVTPGSLSTEPDNLAGDEEYLYFSAFHPDYSEEPWQLALNTIRSPLETFLTSNTLCPGDAITVSVSYDGECIMNPGNVYSVQLSDASGDFTNPTTIGSLASTNLSETISCTIPNSTPSGSGYRLRTASSDPATIGRSNESDITISCPKPENLAVSNITSSSAKLTWGSVACAEKFQVKYRQEGTSGFATLKPSTNSQTISGLAANTSYEAKVRSTCEKNPNTYSSYTSLIHWTTSLKLTGEEMASGFSVYPNPASDVVTIQFPLTNSSDAEISLFDLQGRKIKTIASGNFDPDASAANYLLSFSVDDLLNGVYMLQLKTQAGIFSQKLIVQ